MALLLFNVGVEIGQVLFVGAVLALIWGLIRIKPSWPAWARQVPTYVIGSAAAFWCIERVASFF